MALKAPKPFKPLNLQARLSGIQSVPESLRLASVWLGGWVAQTPEATTRALGPAGTSIEFFKRTFFWGERLKFNSWKSVPRALNQTMRDWEIWSACSAGI